MSAKPYPNEHACRLREPEEFARIRSWDGRIADKPVRFLGGPLREGGGMEVQAIRFPIASWSASDARSHCRGRFEAASGSRAASPTEDRVDLADFDEDLPHSLPGMRPVRFEEVVSHERRAYRALVRPLRAFRRAVFDMLDLGGRRGAKVAWSGYTQQEWDRAIAKFLLDMQGATDIRAAAEGWFFSEAALPTEWRFGMRVGLGRATLLTGASEAALEQTTGDAVRAFGQNAFERLSDQGQSRLANILESKDYPGGSVRSIIQAAVESGENPLTTARDLAGRFDQYERWEFARLTRTEVAFAQEAGIRDELEGEGYRQLPMRYPPLHPSCVCSQTVDMERSLITLDVSATACEACQAALVVQNSLIEGLAERPIAAG